MSIQKMKGASAFRIQTRGQSNRSASHQLLPDMPALRSLHSGLLPSTHTYSGNAINAVYGVVMDLVIVPARYDIGVMTQICLHIESDAVRTAHHDTVLLSICVSVSDLMPLEMRTPIAPIFFSSIHTPVLSLICPLAERPYWETRWIMTFSSFSTNRRAPNLFSLR